VKWKSRNFSRQPASREFAAQGFVITIYISATVTVHTFNLTKSPQLTFTLRRGLSSSSFATFEWWISLIANLILGNGSLCQDAKGSNGRHALSLIIFLREIRSQSTMEDDELNRM
jgi:hypothetical protein